MKTLLFVIMLALPALASCPVQVTCKYHNVICYRDRTEFINGKIFAIFKHGSGASEHEFILECR